MSTESQRVFLSGKMTALALGIPVKIPNTVFNIPTNAPYAEFNIMTTKPFTVGGMGEGKIMERYVGMIQLTVWVPEGKGTKASALACDKFAKHFRHTLGRDLEGWTYTFKSAEVLTPDTKQGYSVQIARIPFHRDEITEVQVSI